MTQTQPRSITFSDANRTFTCTVAPRRASEAALWWWFSVSDGSTSRYAPFLADGNETDESVQTRIVAYYDTHLARRAAPSAPRYGRQAARPQVTQPAP